MNKPEKAAKEDSAESSSENLSFKILKEIEATGYPSELRASAVFASQDWNPTENTYFIDQDEKKGREIDLRAHKCAKPSHSSAEVRVWSMLSAEVKKSDDPWVVVSSARHFLDPSAYGLLHHAHNVNRDVLHPRLILDQHPSKSSDRIGRKAYVAFKGPGHPQIFGALAVATKAAIEEHRAAQDHKEAHSETSLDFVVYTGVNILNGRLFEAFSNASGEVTVQERHYMPYCFHYASPSYPKRSYLMDIVTLKGLPWYLEQQGVWIRQLAETIENGRQ